MEPIYIHKARPGLGNRVELAELPGDTAWSLEYRPGAGYVAAIHGRNGPLLDSGSHATAQAAVDEAVLYSTVHQLYAGHHDGDADDDEEGDRPPGAGARAAGSALWLVLAGLVGAAVWWQFFS
jgi:hypothetical protein